MLFNSLDFIFFLPAVLLAFYLVPHKARVFLLLGASYYFYMCWDPTYILLILLSTVIDYSAGIILGKTEHTIWRRLALYSSLTLNLGMLVVFKYGDFLIQTGNRVAHKLGHPDWTVDALHLLLPVGISFYTFQTMSYTIDVYQRKIRPEKNPFYFALYVSYFPQLVAGPIERFSDLIGQLKQKVTVLPENLEKGIYYILFGFFMKMVIADNIGWYVDQAYTDHLSDPTQNMLLLVLLYPIQIYCDFHGYSTIAIGTARLFGVKLSLNFAGPFWSTSLTTFWRKWHISLTTWFRDYLYFPLGGSKQGYLKASMAILIVFCVSGFWHGANWTFIAWGMWHGVLVVLEKWTGYVRAGEESFVVRIVKGMITFALVAAIFVYFRSPSIQIAHEVLAGLFSFSALSIPALPIQLILLLLLFIAVDLALRKTNIADWLHTQSGLVKWGVCAALLFFVLALSGTNQQPFIYFQF